MNLEIARYKCLSKSARVNLTEKLSNHPSHKLQLVTGSNLIASALSLLCTTECKINTQRLEAAKRDLMLLLGYEKKAKQQHIKKRIRWLRTMPK